MRRALLPAALLLCAFGASADVVHCLYACAIPYQVEGGASRILVEKGQ